MSTNHHTELATNFELTSAQWNANLAGFNTALVNSKSGALAYSGLLLGSGSLGSGSLVGGTSTTQGHLFPPMTETQRDAISTPATGLVIYNTDTASLNYYNGTSWQQIATSDATTEYSLIDSGEDTNVSILTISSIPSTFVDLELLLQIRSRTVANRDIIDIEINDVAGTSYDYAGDLWNTTTNTGINGSNDSHIEIPQIPGGNSNSEWFANVRFTVKGHGGLGNAVAGFWEYFFSVEGAESQVVFGGSCWQIQSDITLSKFDITMDSGDNFDYKFELYGIGNR